MIDALIAVPVIGGPVIGTFTWMFVQEKRAKAIARGQGDPLALPSRRLGSQRIRDRGLREIHARWQHLGRVERKAKADNERFFEQRRKDTIAARQAWATEFEERAGHTWDGPWIGVETPAPKHEGYYANKEHWAALTDARRAKLIREQQPKYMYGWDSLREYSDHEKRQMAIRAAAEWRKAGKPNYREQEHLEELKAIEETRAKEDRKRAKVAKLAAEDPHGTLRRTIADQREKLQAQQEYISALRAEFERQMQQADVVETLSFDGQVYKIPSAGGYSTVVDDILADLGAPPRSPREAL